MRVCATPVPHELNSPHTNQLGWTNHGHASIGFAPVSYYTSRFDDATRCFPSFSGRKLIRARAVARGNVTRAKPLPRLLSLRPLQHDQEHFLTRLRLKRPGSLGAGFAVAELQLVLVELIDPVRLAVLAAAIEVDAFWIRRWVEGKGDGAFRPIARVRGERVAAEDERPPLGRDVLAVVRRGNDLPDPL